VGVHPSRCSAIAAAINPSIPGPSRIDGSTPASHAVSAGSARDLVRAVGAHASERVAQAVVPRGHPAQQPPAGADDLRALLDDLAAELDLVQRLRDPANDRGRARWSSR
jgi:hypothetical protein